MEKFLTKDFGILLLLALVLRERVWILYGHLECCFRRMFIFMQDSEGDD